MRTDSRELLAVGILGGKSRLGDRIELLVQGRRNFSARLSAAGVAVSAAVLGILTLAGSLVPHWIAFAQQAPPAFEVASVKPSPPIGAQGVFLGMVDDPGRFKASYMTVLDLMTRAYGIEHARISGGPSWLSSDRYDVIATLSQDTPPDRIPLLLQTLLAERFKLVVRRDSRITQVYALVPAKGGPKLKRSEPLDSSSPEGRPMLSSAPLMMGSNGALGLCCGRGRLNRVSMERFAALLSAQTDRPVQDETGIQGEFNVALDWASDNSDPQPEGAPLPTGSSIYTAVQEQLGLRLEPRNIPLDYLVVEHAEKPDAN